MARIRTIKPEIRKSLTVASWPYVVRWTFVGLLTYVDDAGRGIDDARLMKAELYPLDDDISAKKISNHLGHLVASDTLCRYEVDGRHYLHFINWHDHQRISHASESRLPACPKHEDLPKLTRRRPKSSGATPESSGTTPEPYGSPPERLLTEQGTGNREQGTGNMKRADARAADAAFDEFWSVYPKRVGKAAARRRWDTLIKRGADPAEITAGARVYARQVRDTETRFIKNPEGWLNAGRWQDEPTTTTTTRPPGWEFGMG